MSTAAVVPTSEMLTLERIKAWAESKAPDAPIGYPCRKDACPVAFYLRDAGVGFVAVDDDEVTWEREYRVSRMVLPPPIQMLVAEIDDLSIVYNVTAADLLAIIAELQP